MTDTHPGPPVIYSASSGVAHIELNRPESFNALSLPLVHALADAVSRAVTDQSVMAILLTGQGRAFCAGGDVKLMAASSDRSTMVAQLANGAHEAILSLARSNKPIIGAVHGSVAGGGVGLACAVDILIAGESTRFVAAYPGIAVTPDCGITWAMPRIVGERRTMQFLLQNQPLDARTAEAWGLVSSVVADDEVLARGRELADSLASNPAAVALGRTRELVHGRVDRTLAEHLHKEAMSIAHHVGLPESAALVDRFAGR